MKPLSTKPILILSAITYFLVASSCTNTQANLVEQEIERTQLVNIFIGTDGHGHTYPGASLPFGMVQLSPDNGTEGWDWSSGYHYSDSVIAGFSHLHLSGTGIGDYCDISFMPFDKMAEDRPAPAAFQHAQESAQPGFYQVTFDNGIGTALTVTERTGIHQYSFPANAKPAISLDLGFHINWDEPTQTAIWVLNDSTIAGYRYSTGWAKDQRIYFHAQFSVPFKEVSWYEKEEKLQGDSVKGQFSQGVFEFPDNADTILVKVGLSTADEAGAEKSIAVEAAHWNFEQYVAEANDIWESELQKVQVNMLNPALDSIFHTALYHASLVPNLHSDLNGKYKGANDEIVENNELVRYTVFSLWDTFRASHPMFSLLQEEKNHDFLNSIMAFFDEYGKLPVWALAGNETNTMTGYHAVPILADALQKGYLSDRAEEVFAAMKVSAEQEIRGTDFYRQYGFIPADKDGWSVTKTLEYAYDDWCIAQVAKMLDKDEEYVYFMERAGSYRALFDDATLFMRGKNSDGRWQEPFDPFHSEHGFDGIYVEGTAWQHSWFVPHDVQGLIDLFPSEDGFIQHLDSTFNVSSEMTGENVSADISGMIGQYAHGNEPSHHIPYLYNYTSEPWKAQQKIRQIMLELYQNTPDGLPGNEDCGQMSAWYVFSALGFYPVNPAEGLYVIGSPLVKDATIALENGNSFRVTTENNSPINPYIQAISLNGNPLNRLYISHDEIIAGGTLHFEMGDTPHKALYQNMTVPPSMSAKQ